MALPSPASHASFAVKEPEAFGLRLFYTYFDKMDGNESRQSRKEMRLFQIPLDRKPPGLYNG